MNYSEIVPFFFLYYLYFLIIVGIIFFTGYVFLNAIKKYFKVSTPFAYCYLATFAGTVILVTIYALLITGFKTILIGFLLTSILLLYPLFIRKTNDQYIYKPQPFITSPKLSLGIILNLLVISFAVFGLEAFFLFKDGSFFHVLPHHDMVVYGHVSKSLVLTGQENTFTVANFLSEESRGLSPYHYFELWLNAGISELFSISTIVSLQFITYPILYFISALGMLSLAEYVMPLNIIRKIIAVFLLVCGGLYFNFYQNIPLIGESYIYVINPVSSIYRKLISFYPFVILFVLFFLEKRYYMALTIFISIPIVSISAFFAVYGGTILFLIIDQLYLKLLVRRTFVGVLLNTFLMMGLIATLYSLYGNKFLVEIKTEDVILFYQKHLNTAIITWRNIIAGSLIQVIALYLPYGLLLYIVLFKMIKGNATNKALLVVIGSVFSVALISWALLYFFIEGIQFFYNFSFIIINVILCYYILLFIKNYSMIQTYEKIIRICMIGLGVVFIFIKTTSIWEERKVLNSTYSDEYIVAILAETSLFNSNGIGVCLYGQDHYTDSFSKLPSYNFLGSYLSYYNKFFHTVNLSSFDIPFENDGYVNEIRVNSAIGNSIFYRFVTDQKNKGVFKSVEESQIDFIDRFNISYAILEKDAIASEMLTNRFTKVIVDSESGERFAFLKSNF